ncbi:MAG TPA: hypothetical protein VLH13_00675, partial [Methanomassiliicoccales archaeon]|nr:hypothetical protein [Methanomassiliicoccales archaeon]
MATRTWISDTAKNSDESGGFDGVPEVGDDLLFTSAHTGTCTINQALAFGSITLDAGCGEVDQGAVDFSYTSINIAGGVWKGVVTQWQGCSGPFVQSNGTMTANTVKLYMTGATANLDIKETGVAGLYALRCAGAISNLKTHITGQLIMDVGSSLSIASGKVFKVNRYNGAQYIFSNLGEIKGAGTMTFVYYDANKTDSFGIINCPVSIFAFASATADRIVSVGGGSRFGSTVLISSGHATRTMIVNIIGGSLEAIGLVTVSTRGVLKSTVAKASMRIVGGVTVAANGVMDNTNISLIQCDGPVDTSLGTLTTGSETWIFGGVGKTVKLAAAQTLHNVIVKSRAAGLKLLADATIDNLYAYVNPIDPDTFTLTKSNPACEYSGL